MDYLTIQTEIQHLPADQQDSLAGFLTALRMQREGLITEIQKRLDDDSPESWVSWEDAKDIRRADGA